MDEAGSTTDVISSTEHGSFHFLLSGNWICRRILGVGIIIENNVSGEKIHLVNNSNGWFTIQKKDEARAYNFLGEQDSLLPVIIKEK